MPKKTLAAALLASLFSRALRRLIGVGLLAALAGAAVAIGGHHDVGAGDVRRMVRCETGAVARAVKQLRDANSSTGPVGGRRELRALRSPGRCHRQHAPTTMSRSEAQR